MIISRTPMRISFMGGGSDLPSFYTLEPGAVVSTTINYYIYINVNAKFDHRIRVSYSVTEIVDRLEEIKHDLVREAMRLTGVTSGVEITSISDIPSSGTGMGSSSAYTVGLLNALYAYVGRHTCAEQLASEASWIEIDKLGHPIGKQDQYIASYGGFQYIQFNPDGTVFVNPIICKPETRALLQSRLLLLYTGVTRSANEVLKQAKSNIETTDDARCLLRVMTKMAQRLRDSLSTNDLDGFGEMLHDAWMMKRCLAAGVSNGRIDEWYERARKAGALGGKILGAGGGGFLLLYADRKHHDRIAAELPELTRIPIRFEPQGSKIMYIEERDCWRERSACGV